MFRSLTRFFGSLFALFTPSRLVPVPRLFPSLSTPYSRLVSRRRGEGSTNEERDDRDETRNTGDDQGSVCKVGTQDPENLDEELKPLVTVWSRLYPSSVTRVLRSCFTPSTRAGT